MRKFKITISLLLVILTLAISANSAQSQVPNILFAAVYERDRTGDAGSDDIWVNIHRTDGVVEEVQVTDTEFDDENDPSITMAPNGNIIVTWDVERNTVYYSVLDLAGNFVKNPTALSTGPDDRSACVAVTPNNVVFVVWESYDGTSTDDVAYVTMDVNGNNVSTEKRITAVAQDITDPTVAASTKNNDDNRVVIVWEDYDGAEDQVAFTILDSNGNTLVAKKTITTTTESNEEINAAILPNGNTVIVWEGDGTSPGDDVGYVIIGSSGGLVVPVTFLARPNDIDSPCVAATPEGNIMIAWDEEGAGENDDIWYIVLNSNGDIVKPASQLTASDEDVDEPDVAVDQTGKTVIIYEQPLSPDDRIDFSILNSVGNKLGGGQLTDGIPDDTLDGDGGWRQVATRPGGQAAVGGVVAPVNKLEILTPYLALAGLVAVMSAVIVVKSRKD
ncbi:hypothetical protein [[Eubacterium] cellulosolvens]